MSRWVVIFTVLVLIVVAQAALVSVKIPSPGATGMNSNTDVQELKITDSPYLENVNTQRLPGQINKRFPLRSVSDNNVAVYAVFGYYDPSTGMKQIVSVANHIDSLTTGFTADTTFYETGADTVAPFIRVSNRFEGGVQDSTIKIAGFLGAPPYRSVLFDGALAITSRGNIPLVYSPYGLTVAHDNHQADSQLYEPHVFSMGVEAPGQPRAGVLNDDGILFGTYRWSTGGLPSRWVTLDSQKAFITLIEAPPTKSPDITGDTGTFLVTMNRQKFNDEWYFLDTFTMGVDQHAVYVDNNADGFSYKPSGKTFSFIDTDDPVRLVSVNNESFPGGLRMVSLTGADDTVSTKFYAEQNVSYFDSTYYVAYSYYDPVTGMESPMGPIMKTGGINVGTLVDSFDSGPTKFVMPLRKGYTKAGERPPWIRVYHGTANDSLMWYGFAQLRANKCWHSDTTILRYTIYPGLAHDSQLTDGQSTHKVGNDPYSQYEIFQEEDGGAFIRPPYIEQLQIGYTDITYSNGRFWGIGDQLFPLRLYYSTYNDMFQWSAISFLSMNEDDVDELVAIEVLPSQNLDVLFAIAHNATYMISGYDPEFDLTWQTISSEIGAISRRATVRKGDAIYFLSMDMRIYELTSSRGLREISQPIENYIDTLFTNAETAEKICVVYALQDKIVFSDTANNRSLVYVPRNNWWGLERYATDFEPIGSFQYDSTRGNFSQDQSDYWIYQGGTGEKFVAEFISPTSGSIVDTINGFNFNYSAIYRTPYVGDGQNLYQITKCDIVGRWTGGTMKIRIVNGFGAQLDSVEVIDLAPQADRMHIIGMPSHQGSYLALEFVSNTLVQRYDIHSVVVHYKRVGRVALK